jgi:Ras-related protein Rab-7A
MNDAQGHHKSLLKVVVLGDAGVGKTSLVKQYVEGTFDESYKPTIGADFLTKDITLPKLGQQKLQIWDTAGQERFRSMAKSFYRGADACVLVYDIYDVKTFQNLDMWKKEFLDSLSLDSSAGDFPFVVLGNKADKVDCGDDMVTKSRAEAWCKAQSNISLFETSALSKQNLNEAFDTIAIAAGRCPPPVAAPPDALLNVQELDQGSTIPEVDQKLETVDVVDEKAAEVEPAYSEVSKSHSDTDEADMFQEAPRVAHARRESPDESSKRGRKKTSKTKKKKKTSSRQVSVSGMKYSQKERYQKKKSGRTSRRGSVASNRDDSREDTRSRTSYEELPRVDRSENHYRRNSSGYRHGRNDNIRLEDDDSYSTGSEAPMMCCDF